MNKNEMIEFIAERAGLSKADAEKALNAFTDGVAEALVKDDKVAILGFGTYEKSHRSAREGRNPQTGAVMQIAATNVAKFKAGKKLKDAINQDTVN